MPGATGPLVAGVDCSTQSTKVVVCDAATGRTLRSATAAHPEGTEVHPDAWGAAFDAATRDGLLDAVAAIAVAGQQHGLVTLDGDGAVVRPALLWNDTRSAGAAADLVTEYGGPQRWAQAVGSVPVASFTVTKLRWLAEHEPEHAARVSDVLLPHDWLTRRLLGASGEPSTDRSDASGTGYWSPGSGAYREDLLRLAFGRVPRVPRVLGPAEPAGETPGGMLVAAGAGDNAGAALGLGAGPADVVVSLGTSGTVFAVSDTPTADASGAVAGFADATGRFLPLVCTLNAARVLDATARLLGTDHAGLDRLALDAAAGAGGLVLVPYLDGERTPDAPEATGSLHGLTRASMTPENLARAAVEGMLCGLADGLDALRGHGVAVRRVLLVGGAGRSAAVQAVAPDVFGVPVEVPAAAEYVALGAARQAAWALAGASGSGASGSSASGPSASGRSADPPRWEPHGPVSTLADPDVERGAQVRAAYAAARDVVLGRAG